MSKSISPGQRRVVEALLSSSHGKTYPAVAKELGIGLGTVHTHLRRRRVRWPELYEEIMAIRHGQLQARHEVALINAAFHSEQWHRRQSARRYYRRFGAWPREVKFYRQIGRVDFLRALPRSRG